MNAAARLVSVGVVLAMSAACQGAPTPTASLQQPTTPTASQVATPTTSVPTPASSSSPSAAPTLPPTPEPTPPVTPPATAEPTPQVTAEPTPESTGLVIDWRQRGGDHGFGRPYDDNQTATFHSGAVFANRYFIAGALEDDDFNQDRGLWSSTDGLSWEREDLPNMNEVYETAANAAGLLVIGGPDAGSGLWLTTNGSDWEQVVVTALPEEWISTIGAMPAGFVAIGSGVWTSTNGREWLPVESTSALDLAAAGAVKLTSHGDRMVALTGGGSSNVCCGPLVVWTSTNLVDWTRVTALPGTRRVHDPTLAGGPLGWIITGYDSDSERSDFMWWSADGQSWTEVTPPIGPISDVFVDEVGFVAVGFLFIGTGCALDPSEIQGLTWTSLDGRTWTQMPLDDFLHKRIDHLFRDGRTLIGVGLSYDPEVSSEASGSVWTVRLPALAPQGPGPTPAPTPTPDPGGCGPG